MITDVQLTTYSQKKLTTTLRTWMKTNLAKKLIQTGDNSKTQEVRGNEQQYELVNAKQKKFFEKVTKYHHINLQDSKI